MESEGEEILSSEAEWGRAGCRKEARRWEVDRRGRGGRVGPEKAGARA